MGQNIQNLTESYKLQLTLLCLHIAGHGYDFISIQWLHDEEAPGGQQTAHNKTFIEAKFHVTTGLLSA